MAQNKELNKEKEIIRYSELNGGWERQKPLKKPKSCLLPTPQQRAVEV